MPATGAVLRSRQCLRALQRANEVRFARAALKHRVADGEISAAEVILSPAAEIEGMTVGDLLLSQRRWGHTRCRMLLSAVPLSETKTVGSMTDRQRHALAALLAALDPAASASPGC
jgi:hypothetical protein